MIRYLAFAVFHGDRTIILTGSYRQFYCFRCFRGLIRAIAYDGVNAVCLFYFFTIGNIIFWIVLKSTSIDNQLSRIVNAVFDPDFAIYGTIVNGNRALIFRSDVSLDRASVDSDVAHSVFISTLSIAVFTLYLPLEFAAINGHVRFGRSMDRIVKSSTADFYLALLPRGNIIIEFAARDDDLTFCISTDNSNARLEISTFNIDSAIRSRKNTVPDS